MHSKQPHLSIDLDRKDFIILLNGVPLNDEIISDSIVSEVLKDGKWNEELIEVMPLERLFAVYCVCREILFGEDEIVFD